MQPELQRILHFIYDYHYESKTKGKWENYEQFLRLFVFVMKVGQVRVGSNAVCEFANNNKKKTIQSYMQLCRERDRAYEYLKRHTRWQAIYEKKNYALLL